MKCSVKGNWISLLRKRPKESGKNYLNSTCWNQNKFYRCYCTQRYFKYEDARKKVEISFSYFDSLKFSHLTIPNTYSFIVNNSEQHAIATWNNETWFLWMLSILSKIFRPPYWKIHDVFIVFCHELVSRPCLFLLTMKGMIWLADVEHRWPIKTHDMNAIKWKVLFAINRKGEYIDFRHQVYYYFIFLKKLIIPFYYLKRSY